MIPPISEDVIARLKNGDKEAFVLLYNSIHKHLYSYIFSFLKSESLSEDILQEVFIKIWEIRDRLDSIRFVEAYVYKITRNAIFKMIKTMAKDKAASDIYAQLNDISDTKYRSLGTANLSYESFLADAIASLPPQRQKIFRLCKEKGHSYEQVAKKLNISRHTVKEHMVLALKAIRSFLDQHSREEKEFILFCLIVFS